MLVYEGNQADKTYKLSHTHTHRFTELFGHSLCVSVTTAVRPSEADAETKGLPLQSKAMPETQGVLHFLFLCTICAANKDKGEQGRTFAKKTIFFFKVGGSNVQAHNSSYKKRQTQHLYLTVCQATWVEQLTTCFYLLFTYFFKNPIISQSGVYVPKLQFHEYLSLYTGQM